jgi:hypothetical protein
MSSLFEACRRHAEDFRAVLRTANTQYLGADAPLNGLALFDRDARISKPPRGGCLEMLKIPGPPNSALSSRTSDPTFFLCTCLRGFGSRGSIPRFRRREVRHSMGSFTPFVRIERSGKAYAKPACRLVWPWYSRPWSPSRHSRQDRKSFAERSPCSK